MIEMTCETCKAVKNELSRLYQEQPNKDDILDNIKRLVTTTYKQGDVFKHDDTFYILTRTNTNNEIVLSSLNDGNLWSEPKKVAHRNNITLDEFRQITNSSIISEKWKEFKKVDRGEVFK